MSDRLLTPAEVAEILGVTERWVKDATREGRIPSVRLGRWKHYKPETIAAWIDEQESTKRAPTSRSRR